MQDEQHDPSWIERYERLSFSEKLGFLAEGSVRLAAAAIEGAADRTAAIIVRARKAYQQGLDPNIIEAKILEERSEKLQSHNQDDTKDDT